MNIIPLSEGSFTIDKTKLFVPFDENTQELNERPVGSLLVEIQPFVVVTSRDILLLDTGLGFPEKNGTLQLHQNLMNAGINPSEVTKVLLSHLHKDHSGGVGIKNKEGENNLSFPRAKYYIQQKEFDIAFEKGFPSYLTKDLECLRDKENVEWLDGNGMIEDYIEYKVTAAHSPYHQVFWIEEEGEKIFFGGDDAPQIQQMKHRFMAKYDFNGKKTMELRQEWWKQGLKEGWTFLFYHDIKTPIFANKG